MLTGREYMNKKKRTDRPSKLFSNSIPRKKRLVTTRVERSINQTQHLARVNGGITLLCPDPITIQIHLYGTANLPKIHATTCYGSISLDLLEPAHDHYKILRKRFRVPFFAPAVCSTSLVTRLAGEEEWPTPLAFLRLTSAVCEP